MVGPDHVGRAWLVFAAVVVTIAAACSSPKSDDASPSSSSSASSSMASQPSWPTASASPACSSVTERPAIDRLDVIVAGTPRSALVHLPAQWDGTEAIPTVLSLHGAGANAAVAAVQDGLDSKADAEGFVVLRPEALALEIDASVTDTSWWDLTGRTVDDVAFVASLLDELGRQVCIDPSRVFAVGFSLGGEMAMAAACALPDRIAAFAQVEAGRSVPCTSGRPTPALAFHGTGDLIAPYAGRPEDDFLPAEDLMDEQARRNGCSTRHDVRPVTPNVEELTWVDCDAPTVLYRLQDHGHAWPGNPLPFPPEAVDAFLRGPDGQPNAAVAGSGLTIADFAANVLLTNTEINATDLMWDFFATGEARTGT